MIRYNCSSNSMTKKDLIIYSFHQLTSPEQEFVVASKSSFTISCPHVLLMDFSAMIEPL